jgi:hypothetical protein
MVDRAGLPLGLTLAGSRPRGRYKAGGDMFSTEASGTEPVLRGFNSRCYRLGFA